MDNECSVYSFPESLAHVSLSETSNPTVLRSISSCLQSLISMFTMWLDDSEDPLSPDDRTDLDTTMQRAEELLSDIQTYQLILLKTDIDQEQRNRIMEAIEFIRAFDQSAVSRTSSMAGSPHSSPSQQDAISPSIDISLNSQHQSHSVGPASAAEATQDAVDRVSAIIAAVEVSPVAQKANSQCGTECIIEHHVLATGQDHEMTSTHGESALAALMSSLHDSDQEQSQSLRVEMSDSQHEREVALPAQTELILTPPSSPDTQLHGCTEAIVVAPSPSPLKPSLRVPAEAGFTSKQSDPQTEEIAALRRKLEAAQLQQSAARSDLETLQRRLQDAETERDAARAETARLAALADERRRAETPGDTRTAEEWQGMELRVADLNRRLVEAEAAADRATKRAETAELKAERQTHLLEAETRRKQASEERCDEAVRARAVTEQELRQSRSNETRLQNRLLERDRTARSDATELRAQMAQLEEELECLRSRNADLTELNKVLDERLRVVEEERDRGQAEIRARLAAALESNRKVQADADSMARKVQELERRVTDAERLETALEDEVQRRQRAEARAAAEAEQSDLLQEQLMMQERTAQELKRRNADEQGQLIRRAQKAEQALEAEQAAAAAARDKSADLSQELRVSDQQLRATTEALAAAEQRIAELEQQLEAARAEVLEARNECAREQAAAGAEYAARIDALTQEAAEAERRRLLLSDEADEATRAAAAQAARADTAEARMQVALARAAALEARPSDGILEALERLAQSHEAVLGALQAAETLTDAAGPLVSLRSDIADLSQACVQAVGQAAPQLERDGARARELVAELEHMAQQAASDAEDAAITEQAAALGAQELQRALQMPIPDAPLAVVDRAVQRAIEEAGLPLRPPIRKAEAAYDLPDGYGVYEADQQIIVSVDERQEAMVTPADGEPTPVPLVDYLRSLYSPLLVSVGLVDGELISQPAVMIDRTQGADRSRSAGRRRMDPPPPLYESQTEYPVEDAAREYYYRPSLSESRPAPSAETYYRQPAPDDSIGLVTVPSRVYSSVTPQEPEYRKNSVSRRSPSTPPERTPRAATQRHQYNSSRASAQSIYDRALAEHMVRKRMETRRS